MSRTGGGGASGGEEIPTKGKGSGRETTESSSDSEKGRDQRTARSGQGASQSQRTSLFPAPLSRDDWNTVLCYRNLHKQRDMLYNKKLESAHNVGRRVELIANHFQTKMSDSIKLCQYDVSIHRRTREDIDRFPTGNVTVSTTSLKTYRLERETMRQVFWQAVKDNTNYLGNMYNIIYDGQNICYIQKKLEHLKWVANVSMTTFDDSSMQHFLVFITFAGHIGMEIDPVEMRSLDYRSSLEYSRKKLQVLDLLIRQSRSNPHYSWSSMYVPAGGNMFLIPRGPRPDLKPNLEHWQGFFQAHHMSQDGKVTLNFDVANSGFFKQKLHFVDYMCNFISHMHQERGTRPPPGAWFADSRNIRPGPDGTNIFAEYRGDLAKELRTARMGKMLSKLNNNPKGIQIKWQYKTRDDREVVRVKRFVSISDKPATETTFVMKVEECEKLGIPVQPGIKAQPPRGRGRGMASSRGGNVGGGAEVSVAQYFELKYSIKLDFPLLPPVQFKGKGGGLESIPMEFCWVYNPQRFTGELNADQLQAIIKEAATPAPLRKKKIEELAASCQFSQDPWLQAFEYKVRGQMLTISNANILPPPSIVYGGNATAQPRDGTWKHPPRARLYEPGRIEGFGLLTVCLSQPDEGAARGPWLREFITRDCVNFGIQTDTNNYKEKSERDTNRIVQALREIKDGLVSGTQSGSLNPTLIVFCVLPRKDASIYAAVKRAAEIDVGIMTQCIIIKTVKGFKPMTGENIALKVNCKIGGVNWLVQPSPEVGRMIPRNWPKRWSDSPMLVLGVDVVHPASVVRPGSQTTFPSVSAVVGNICDEFKSFRGTIKLQCRRQEHIVYMMEAVKDRLRDYVDNCGKKPELIVVYRDGVSEGSYQEVLVEEVSRIRAACHSLDISFKPNIVYIIANKRHHTRFFAGNPQVECGRAKNVPPGTTVNNTVTSPCGTEFFQVAHFGIQGTSRPVKYSIVFNDGDQSLDFIENLTFHLTHAFHRCPRSVHIPGPLYLADLLCRRADCYIKHLSFGMTDDTRSVDESGPTFRDETSTKMGSGSGSGGRSESHVSKGQKGVHGKGKGSSSSDGSDSDASTKGMAMMGHKTGKSFGGVYSTGEDPPDLAEMLQAELTLTDERSLLASQFHEEDIKLEAQTRVLDPVQEQGRPHFI